MVELDQIYNVYPNLYIGAYWSRLNFEKFKELGITAIVNLMDENYYNPTNLGFKYLFKGFPDDWYPPHSYIEEILQFIDNHIKNGKVLVHCAMGISRSGGLIVAWVMKENPGWSWTQALKEVHKKRLVYPAIEIKMSILDYFESIEDYRRKD